MIWLPDAEAVKRIHLELVDVFKDGEDPISPPGVKNEALLISACDRPNTGIGNTDKYKTVYKKAGALFHSLVKNHPFHNGNKRTGLVALLTMLHRNDLIVSQTVSDDDIFDFTLDVTADRFPDEETASRGPDAVVDQIGDWLKGNTERLDHQVGPMKASEFMNLCIAAGATVKEASGGKSYNVKSAIGGLTFRKTAKKFDGPVVRLYLKKLGFTLSLSGLSAGEFQQGVMAERDEIHRFMAALQRLAKT